MNIAMDDATKCNARQRIVELNGAYPEISGIYVDKDQEAATFIDGGVMDNNVSVACRGRDAGLRVETDEGYLQIAIRFSGCK